MNLNIDFINVGVNALCVDIVSSGLLRFIVLFRYDRQDKFMYVSNRASFGHLLSAEGFETTHLFNEMWQLTENRWDWEQRYLHPNYSQALAKDFQNEMVRRAPSARRYSHYSHSYGVR